jgi:hypothetical protein
MDRNSLRQKHLEQAEMDKVRLNLENLRKANKISVKFSLRYFIDFFVDGQNDRELYSEYFV